MITFGLNYDVKEAHVAEFVRISREALAMIHTLEGHVQTVLYANVDKPNSFLIYSEWDNDDHFKAFMKSDAFKAVQTMTGDMLEQRPKHKMYETRQMGR